MRERVRRDDEREMRVEREREKREREFVMGFWEWRIAER